MATTRARFRVVVSSEVRVPVKRVIVRVEVIVVVRVTARVDGSGITGFDRPPAK